MFSKNFFFPQLSDISDNRNILAQKPAGVNTKKGLSWTFIQLAISFFL